MIEDLGRDPAVTKTNGQRYAGLHNFILFKRIIRCNLKFCLINIYNIRIIFSSKKECDVAK